MEAGGRGGGGVKGRGEHFVDLNLVADYGDHVGEGAAGVHSDDYRARAAPLHAGLNKILKLSGSAAASNAARPPASVKVPSISGRGSILLEASASRAG